LVVYSVEPDEGMDKYLVTWLATTAGVLERIAGSIMAINFGIVHLCDI
jgi:hypothetical protein